MKKLLIGLLLLAFGPAVLADDHMSPAGNTVALQVHYCALTMAETWPIWTKR